MHGSVHGRYRRESILGAKRGYDEGSCIARGVNKNPGLTRASSLLLDCERRRVRTNRHRDQETILLLRISRLRTRNWLLPDRPICFGRATAPKQCATSSGTSRVPRFKSKETIRQSRLLAFVRSRSPKGIHLRKKRRGLATSRPGRRPHVDALVSGARPGTQGANLVLETKGVHAQLLKSIDFRMSSLSCESLR